MPKILVTEYDVAARKHMQDCEPTELKLNETFRHELNLHIPLQSRKLVIEVHPSDVPRVSRNPIMSAKVDYPKDYKVSFLTHAKSPEVYITILHWLNATFIVASGSHIRAADLAQRFETSKRNKLDELPAFFFVGDLKKDIRSQRITTIPSAIRQPEMA